MPCPLDELGVLQQPALPGAFVMVYYNPTDAEVPDRPSNLRSDVLFCGLHARSHGSGEQRKLGVEVCVAVWAPFRQS
jgi:hypothetical protein